MVGHGAARHEIAQRLSSAYADGLLSQQTFASRIEHLLERRLIDPRSLIGDLTFRSRRSWRAWVGRAQCSVGAWTAARRGQRELLLALDWTGSPRQLLIGRHHACDIVLPHRTVSRQHARLIFRDGGWVVQDLESMNGTTVNGAAVGRCVLQPGDRLALGAERLRVD